MATRKSAPAKRHRGTTAEVYRSVLYCGLMCASLVKRRAKMSEFMFYIELFAEQMLLGSSKEPLTIQPVQVARHLQAMADQDLVAIEKRETHTYYTIAASGFHHMLHQLILDPRRLPLEDSLFLAHVFNSYSPQLLRLVPDLSADERPAMQALLQPGMILVHQLTHYDQTIGKILRRQADYQRVITYVAQASGAPLDELIQHLPLGPSIRQSYKSTLREAMSALPDDLKAWELRSGFSSRLNGFYSPYLEGLQSERRILASRLAGIQAALSV